MSLHSKRLSLADVRLKIFTEMEADLEAQFLELMELRERVRRAKLSAHLQQRTWAGSKTFDGTSISRLLEQPARETHRADPCSSCCC